MLQFAVTAQVGCVVIAKINIQKEVVTFIVANGREPRIPSDPPVSVQRIHDNWRLKFRATVIGIGEEISKSVKTSTPWDLLMWRLVSGSACSLFIFEKIPYGSTKKQSSV